jgi:DNA-binding protein YbaB
MSTLSQLFKISTLNLSNILNGAGILKVTANNQITLSLDSAYINSLIASAFGSLSSDSINAILNALKTVDGIGSGLDADLLDGQQGAYYLNFTNLTNLPSTLLGHGISSSSGLLLQADPIHPLDAATMQYVDAVKASVSNVNNTSDLAKPISTLTQTALNLKADLASPTFTGTVNGITKSMVGLGNVDNTSDVNKPISTAVQTTLNLKANIASPTFTGTVSGITSSMVGLGNLDNTSDLNKPISTAVQNALNLKQNLSDKGIPSGYCPLNSSGQIDTSYMPDSTTGQLNYQGQWNASTNTPTMAAAATGNKGYYFIVSVAGSTSVNGTSSWNIGDWIISNGTVWSKIAISSAVTSVAGRTGTVVLTSTDVGLANVNNTSDAAKPISDLTLTALNLKATIASPTFTGTVSGITASMVGLGNVTNTSDANKPVSTLQQAALDLKAPLASPAFTGTVTGITATMVGLGNVTNTSDANKPVSTAQQSALDLKANLASPTFTGTVSGITATMVGLGNVNNTSDTAKPISSATQSALDLKAPVTNASLVSPALGTPTSGNLVNCTFPTFNQNTSGNAATATLASGLVTTNNYQIGGLGVGTAASGTTGEIRAINNITAYYSDARLKTIINPISDALSKLLTLSGVLFTSNDVAATFGYTDTKTQVGVIAQQVEAVLPQIVVPAPFDIGVHEDGSEYSISGQDYKTVQYEKLAPLFIEAIKELNYKVESLIIKLGTNL